MADSAGDQRFPAWRVRTPLRPRENGPAVHRFLAVAVAVVLLAGLSSAAAVGGRPSPSPAAPASPRAEPANQAPVDAAGVPAVAPEPATTVVPPPIPRPTGPVPLAGCPPPPPPPGPPSAPPWHPAVLVPEAALPQPAPPPTGRTVGLDALAGKGMWLWQFNRSENGNADSIVTKADAAGLSQLWVRVGDSQDGFYAANALNELVPKAHARGISVMGWGFPYLYDPSFDARWTADALAWRGPRGERLDGFSPDLETGSEGVLVTERRLQVYLGQVNAASPDRPVIATVFRPTDRLWSSYPYGAVAPYVDGFAAMVYWGCTEPGAAAAQAISRLAALRPVHVIGQAYNMADEGGRRVQPSGDETWRFLDVAHAGGAVGASFWDWQEINQEQWAAMAEYPWPVYARSVGRR
ncbi:MAG: hypothetical protein JO086_04345 [Acidimicrobiia bacterium]|nr:hypothetical protein [Acidimicrobiia bacterium]